MKLSPNGAPILNGEGVAAVRKKIEDAFRDARTNVRTHSAKTRIETAEKTQVEVFVEVKQTEPCERSLETKASLYLRAAEKHIKHAVGRRRHGHAYHISVPTEDAANLIEQALRSFD